MTFGAGCQARTGSDCTLDALARAGTLMHELGHGLGLRHGGDDDVERKPNYLSVMNYSFQLGGLIKADLSPFLDYSRFTLAPLNENALDETHGFGISSGAAAALNTLGHCPNAAQTMWGLLDGFTDFDCNGANGGTVASDVNKSGGRTVLTSFTDWPALQYGGGAIGGSGAELPDQTPVSEPPLEELLAHRDFVEAARAAAAVTPTPTPAAPSPSGGATATPPAPVALPALRRLRIARSRLKAGRGAKVSFTLSTAARVRFTVERLLPGRRKGARCRPPRQAPRGRRCQRVQRVRGSVIRTGVTGANAFRFRGRIAGRPLRRGAFRLVATPVAPDGRAGAPLRVAFKVVR